MGGKGAETAGTPMRSRPLSGRMAAGKAFLFMRQIRRASPWVPAGPSDSPSKGRLVAHISRSIDMGAAFFRAPAVVEWERYRCRRAEIN